MIVITPTGTSEDISLLYFIEKNRAKKNDKNQKK